MKLKFRCINQPKVIFTVESKDDLNLENEIAFMKERGFVLVETTN